MSSASYIRKILYLPVGLLCAVAFVLSQAGTSLADNSGGVDAGTAATKAKKPKPKKKQAKPREAGPKEGVKPEDKIATTPGAGGLVTGIKGKKLELTITSDGIAEAPAWAPAEIQAMAAAANDLNQVAGYSYGASHDKFPKNTVPRYVDCSSAVSYVLYKASLLSSPLDSTGFYSYGAKGPGKYVTIWTNPGHAFLQIANLRVDTSHGGRTYGSHARGPTWGEMISTKSYRAVHPPGF